MPDASAIFDLLSANRGISLFLAAVICLLLLRATVKIAWEYQRAVVFRLGRQVGVRGPGLFVLVPLIERAVFVDLRTITQQLDTQETLTRDGVAVKVSAVLWFLVADPAVSVVAVADWKSAVRQAAETAMRDAIGQTALENLLKDRLAVNALLLKALSVAVAKWGVQIEGVEIRDLDIPEAMQRAIAKEAEATREKAARVILAQGELDASAKLSEAARIMAETPGAMDLRRMQTITQIGAEHNSTIVIALPLDAQAAGIIAGLAAAGRPS